MPDIFVSDDLKKQKKHHPPTQQTLSQAPKTEESLDSEPVQEPKTKAERERLPGHTHNPLSAFCYYQEKVVLMMRKHPITNVRWIAISLLLVFGPSLMGFFSFLDVVPPNFRLIGILCWYLITTAFVLENFLTWFFNVYFVTDERIIDVDFYNLIYKEVSEAEIEKIQDVTYKMGGVARTIFDYGDVLVQTAAEVPNFEFLAVPSPDKVVKILQDLRIEEKQEALEGRIR